ncbi:MAG TPA: glycerol-3-phosphate dehydrogenase/oxidase [Candidatus Binatia bacterium]|nr:glycerol-3-phosphate dehydrogenase/oxidase [Candidatus Binatia bacterium]
MKNRASAMRCEHLKSIGAGPLDLLVLGGGIVGAGIARDAASRGLRTGLVEQHDFASGTSSRSSRLLHGRLRYLAQGRLGLVHEASVEKKIIHHIAPHLAAPLPFIFPTYADNQDWALWQLKIGVKIYDLLCNGRNLGRAAWLNRAEIFQKIPGLRPDNLTGAVRYFDGFTNDARLTIDTLRSASRHGADIFNYCRFVNAKPGKFWECHLEDRLNQQPIKIRARTVVNATGPWADGLPHSHVKLRVTKGIHLVVDQSRLPVSDTVVMAEGKRILFAIPWGERTILGTTDTDYNGAIEQVAADSGDVHYVLRVTNRFFPNAALTGNDIISSWAGLRPLLADPNGNPSDIARSHKIHTLESGWWDVAGGKLTTHRLMAEQTVDQIVRWLRRHHQFNDPVAPCSTAEEPLLPKTETSGISGITPPEFSRETVEHFCTQEWARHLDDVMIRRTSWKHYLKDDSAWAAQAADWMAQVLNWDTSMKAKELERYLQPRK